MTNDLDLIKSKSGRSINMQSFNGSLEEPKHVTRSFCRSNGENSDKSGLYIKSCYHFQGQNPNTKRIVCKRISNADPVSTKLKSLEVNALRNFSHKNRPNAKRKVVAQALGSRTGVKIKTTKRLNKNNIDPKFLPNSTIEVLFPTILSS